MCDDGSCLCRNEHTQKSGEKLNKFHIIGVDVNGTDRSDAENANKNIKSFSNFLICPLFFLFVDSIIQSKLSLCINRNQKQKVRKLPRSYQFHIKYLLHAFLLLWTEAKRQKNRRTADIWFLMVVCNSTSLTIKNFYNIIF